MDAARQRLFVYNGGFLTQGRVRRILDLAGYDIRLGAPGDGDMVGVWGQSPTSPRGEAVAERRDAPVLRVEDGWLRSLHPGRMGEPPLSLLLDKQGVHFDPSKPSDLEELLTRAPLDDTAILNRARDGIERLRLSGVSKYAAFDPKAEVPEPGYVLVVDQIDGDASVTAQNVGRSHFLEMLTYARLEHPGARILILSHPETRQGLRAGHFTEDDGELFTAPCSPWALLDGAVAVYTISSQLGFEAIMAGHKPQLFGEPFYAGWGLTEDRAPVPQLGHGRRGRALTRAQLFAGAMLMYPTWYDPYRDQLGSFEDVAAALEAETRAWAEDKDGWRAKGMRLWKWGDIQRKFGRNVRFVRGKGRVMSWGADPEADVRVEDGFIRSQGLGAALVPPFSLVTDDLGIYYDPSRPNRLDALISKPLEPGQLRRTEALIRRIVAGGLSKYNLDAAPLPELPEGHRVLVVGQVEDDASLVLGGGEVRTNAQLLEAVKAARPDAVLMWKPHPDVEAGLREGGAVEADVTLAGVSSVEAIDTADEVWTMTSLLGFEALLRGKQVVCTGMPFYAGWGVTTDLIPSPDWRERATLEQVVYGALIAYPRYWDPVTERPCSVEVVISRLEKGEVPPPKRRNRMLSLLQALLRR